MGCLVPRRVTDIQGNYVIIDGEKWNYTRVSKVQCDYSDAGARRAQQVQQRRVRPAAPDESAQRRGAYTK